MFIHARAFSRFCQAVGAGDEQLRKLELDIRAGGGVTESGTGGLKKIRWAAAGKGKSGSRRVIFADYPQFGVTVLLAGFEKSRQGDLNSDERKTLKRFKELQDREMERSYG